MRRLLVAIDLASGAMAAPTAPAVAGKAPAWTRRFDDFEPELVKVTANKAELRLK